MADWGSGYITDTAYVHDFCRVQTPPMLALAALSSGAETAGGAGEPLAYCDLGCGQGYTANLIAAANPAMRVLGVDFHPGHVANARAFASAAGLANAEFREASFEDLANDPQTPDFDIMAMHGVYSWISPANRRALVSLIGKRLKPGGLLYVSYDCMPGWAGVAPLRRIMARAFAPRPGMPSPVAIERALAYSDALRAADSRFHKIFPNVEAQMDRLKKTPRAYLSHELLTRDWEAFPFGDVAADLAEAKLVFVGSAHLTDHIDRVNFTEQQQAFLASLTDLVLAEETRDMLLSRQFRRDVFARGLTTTGPARLRARWLDTRFAWTSHGAEVDLSFETALGKLQLRPDVHGPLIEVLRQGPITLREAIAKLPKPAASWASITDAIKVLVGRGDLQPALPAGSDAARAASARAFNGAVLDRATETAELRYLASPVTGGGVAVDRLSQIYLLAKRRGVADPAALLATLAEGSTPADGEGPQMSMEAARDYGKTQTARIEADVAPLLAALGVD